MVSIEQIIYIVPILALTASVLYYALNLRTANKTQQLQLETRQAQLFMHLYNRFADTEFTSYWTEIIYNWSWIDFDDFWAKYGPTGDLEEASKFIAVYRFFDGIGVLVKREYINMDLVEELMAEYFFRYWDKTGEIITEARTRLAWPDMYEHFEYLHDEMNKRRPEKAKTTIIP